MKNRFNLVLFTCVLMAFAAGAEALDRPSGVKIGERMTLRPSVSTSITYDSNVNPNNAGEKKDDFLWTISPALTLSYDAETWSLLLSGFYNYRYYFDSDHSYDNRHNFGEDLRWNWSNSTGAEKGWSITLGQSFQQITAADDLTTENGQRWSGNSKQFQFSGAIQRRFNQNWHGDINAGYYWLNYDDSDTDQGASTLYGWDRVQVGAEAGFAPSPWTDFIISGGYSYYDQDNAGGTALDNNSQGCTVQGGLGSYMTDRISYRLLAGWSRFEYGGSNGSTSDGFVYTITGNWKIGETWNMSLLGSSYYQPSERQNASKSRVDAISWGIAKSLVRGKLRASFDVRYRHETVESTANFSNDYNLDVWTGRLGGSYTLCRFLSVFAYGEYQNSMNDGSQRRNGGYDYDRWRVTAGLRVQY